jgi:hypothetical protein
MKNLIARTFMSIMFAVMALAATSRAQSIQVIKVNIPFEFNFGGHSFPAGAYSLVQPRRSCVRMPESRQTLVTSASQICKVLQSSRRNGYGIAVPDLLAQTQEGIGHC